MKELYINSYYSEDENVTDGLYLVTYDDSNFEQHDITHFIHITYEHLNDDENGELVHNLGEVLEVLQKEHNIISWKVLDTIKFDCDYGIFTE